MQFLRTLFWMVVTAVVVVLSRNNWRPVTLDLFGGLEADVKLPVLLFAAFLIGFLPTYGWARLRLWQERRAAIVPVAPPSPSPLLAEPPLPATVQPGVTRETPPAIGL